MNGILNLNKPAGFTSFDCVALLRRLTGEKKIGHTGTLDPQATGVLPLCLGKATRLLEYMDETPKTYVAGCMLGLTTDTRDIWGAVLCDRRPQTGPVPRENAEKALASFQGLITQKPPVFSAIKVNGKKLYEYAREGKDVEIPERTVTVYDIRLLEWNGPAEPFLFLVRCSRGTYVRSICHDLGEMLGCGACMSSLVRTETCGYSIEDSLSVDELRSMTPQQIEALLDPPETAVAHLPRIDLDEEQTRLFLNGNPLWSVSIPPREGHCAVFSGGVLIGICEDGVISKVLK